MKAKEQQAIEEANGCLNNLRKTQEALGELAASQREINQLLKEFMQDPEVISILKEECMQSIKRYIDCISVKW